MDGIIIDKEFKSLLPKLDNETLRLLEENILENGCRDSLVLWNGTLVDGHNRHAICVKHGIPFNTIDKEFASREEALIWIINTQVSRRNLSPTALSYFRGLHYRADKKIVTNPFGKKQPVVDDGQNVHHQKNQTTAGRLSEQYNVNEKTIRRDAKGADAIDAIGGASPEAKRMIIDNEVKIDKKDLLEMAAMSGEEIAEIAARIENGTYEKKKAGATALETEQAPETAPTAESATEPSSPGFAQNPAPKPAPTGTASPADSLIACINPLRAMITGISGSFSEELPKITSAAEKAMLKTELRAYIDMLEELYFRI